MRFTFFALLLLSSSAFAKPSDDTWMTVTLDGRKIGNMHMTRRVDGNRVISSQMLNVEIGRAHV